MSKVKLIVGKVEHNPYRETNVVEVEEREFEIDGYYVADRILEGVIEIPTDEEKKEFLESYIKKLNNEIPLKYKKKKKQGVIHPEIKKLENILEKLENK